MASLPELEKWYQEHKAEILQSYFDFLKIPSISADPAYKIDCCHAADWLCAYLKKGGLKVEKIETSGLPLVYAEDLSAGDKAPTLLIYGHYDVQPVDPLELWKSPPFEPTIRDGKVYARGAVDDKGQIFYAIVAAIAFRKLSEEKRINLKFCIEGEEESQSLGLKASLHRLKEKIKADYLLVVDFDQLAPDCPALSLGARGMVGLEVVLTGSNTDLHSGVYGGIAYNPNRALVELLSQLWDESGRVRVPHFYDDISNVSEEELKNYTFLKTHAHYKEHAGIHAFGGERGLSLQETNWLRPTLEINGISGGYGGAGMKTVIPSKALAKISCRLVPNQDPKKILHSIVDFLKKHVIEGMKVDVEVYEGASAFRGSLDSKLAQAAAAAAQEAVGTSCRYILSGASIPIIGELGHASGAEVIGIGFGLEDDGIHAPNEHFDMHRFKQGFLTVGRTLARL